MRFFSYLQGLPFLLRLGFQGWYSYRTPNQLFTPLFQRKYLRCENTKNPSLGIHCWNFWSRTRECGTLLSHQRLWLAGSLVGWPIRGEILAHFIPIIQCSFSFTFNILENNETIWKEQQGTWISLGIIHCGKSATRMPEVVC